MNSPAPDVHRAIELPFVQGIPNGGACATPEAVDLQKNLTTIITINYTKSKKYLRYTEKCENAMTSFSEIYLSAQTSEVPFF